MSTWNLGKFKGRFVGRIVDFSPINRFNGKTVGEANLRILKTKYLGKVAYVLIIRGFKPVSGYSGTDFSEENNVIVEVHPEKAEGGAKIVDPDDENLQRLQSGDALNIDVYNSLNKHVGKIFVMIDA